MSEYIKNNCPTCSSSLVQDRGDHKRCEDCGWPEVDFGGEWEYPKEGEQLGSFQPGLEFLTKDGKWVSSGIVSGIMRNNLFRGEYRYPATGNLNE